jgi:preprotein translocase SecE subunit
MNRQLRRHPVITKPSKPTPIRPSLRTAKAPGAAREGKRRLIAALRPSWLNDITAELRKVTWPTMSDAWNLTVVVIVVCIFFGIGLGTLDFLFSWIVQNTILR